MKIQMLSLTKTIIKTATITGLLAFGSSLSTDEARAFTVTYGDSNTTDGNSGFESGSFNNSSSQLIWNSIGDAGVTGDFTTVSPFDANYQGVITTACPGSAGSECVGTDGLATSRNDDNPATIGAYNTSSNEPVSASVEISTLQDFIGVSAASLQINRENGSISGTRTPKEGSAIKQTFTTDESFTLSFNWNYLTNDGNSTRLGDQDFAFFTIYDNSSSIEGREIIVLDDSSSATNIAADPDGTEFLTEGSYQPETYTSALPAGSYTLSYGVVDVDGVDRSSALLVDNVSIQEIPFEFSPTLGLLLVGGIIGGDRLRRHLKNKNSLKELDL